MTTLEVSPTRGPANSNFAFTIVDAPITEVTRPPFGKDNYCWLYIEAPDGTVVMHFIHRKNCTVTINPLKAWNGDLPPPKVIGWERFLCFIFDAEAMSKPGADITATPIASCILVLDQYTK